jgi:lipopolysaccharide/colanic/teichoic acid biosynthesis glycosyltransferase
MKRKKIFLITLDQLVIVLSFLFFVWLKPGSISKYLPDNIVPFLLYLFTGFQISIYLKKFNTEGKDKYLDHIWPILKTNFATIGMASLVIYAIHFFSFSRMIVLGTILASIVSEIIVFTLFYLYETAGFDFPDIVNKDELYKAHAVAADKTSVASLDEFDVIEKIRVKSREKYSAYGAFNYKLILDERGEKVAQYFERFIDYNDRRNIFSETDSSFNIVKLPDHYFKNLINIEILNNIRRINRFFETVNSKLPKDGLFIGCLETKEIRKKRILKNGWPIFNRIHYFFDYFIKRVWPKLPALKKIYFFITKGRGRVISKAETIGRLYSCGFKLINYATINGYFYFVTYKNAKPAYDYNASYGPIFKMRRIGKNGKEIHVFKFRTMYPYSEYIQEYIYNKHKLQPGGKIRHDFRVTTLGRFMRRFWIDELPMLINWVIGDLKLVGVRPLSKHYLELYDEDIRQKRLKNKPGLIPPFYADMPRTLDEVMESEKRYLDAYEKHHFKTDVRYFFIAWFNIVFRQARSK